MPIINLLNEQNRERKKQGFASLAQTGLAMGAIGGGFYAGLNSAGGFKTNYTKAKNVLTNTGESLGNVGQAIRSDIDTLNRLTKEASESLTNNLKTNILNDSKIDEILGGAGDIEERRALLASLFDTYKAESSDFDEGIKERIRAAYANDTTLSDADRNAVKQFYQGTIASNQDATLRFNSTYSRFSRVKDLLVPGAFDFSSKPSTQVGYNTINNLNDYFTGQAGKADFKTYESQIKKKYNDLRALVGGSRPLELVEIDEFGNQGGIKSLYARISYGEGRVANVNLHLQRNQDGMMFYRGTSNFSTRYVAPQKVINSLDLVKGGYGTKGHLNSAMVDFSDFVFNKFMSQGRTRAANMSSRDINNYNAFLRSFGPDAPRAMVDQINKGITGLVSRELQENLSSSRLMQSSSIFLGDIEKLGREDQKNIVSNLMRMFPDTFGGPGNAQTMTTRMEDPFSANNELKFLQINLLKNNNVETFNSFSAMKSFGRIDRAILPQTARETQMIGRPEFLYGDTSQKMGKNRNIARFGSGADLLGVSGTAGKYTHGANIASFMVMGKKAQQLGLSEGTAYNVGQTFKIKSNITKTVHERGIERFELMDILEKKMRASTGDRFIKVGGTGADYTIDEFFTKFGKGGEAILGLGDSGYSSIKRHTGLEEFTLGITEITERSGRKSFSLSGEGVKSLPLMKLFSPVFKGTLEGLDDIAAGQRMTAMGLGSQYTEFMKHTADAIITDDSMLGKAPQYLAAQMFGGFKYFGGDTGDLETDIARRMGDDADYLASIRKVAGATSVKDLESAPVAFRQAAFIENIVESIIDKSAGMSVEERGMILGGYVGMVEEGKFGLTSQRMQELFKGQSDLLREAKKGVAVGATFASSGDVYTDLGRNIAKIEPRFANYMYQSLRHNFNASEEDATRYLSNLLVRREGIEQTTEGLLGMKTAQFSLSPGATATSVKRQLEGLSGIDSVSKDAMREIYGASSEREIIDVLSRNQRGNIIETANLGLSSKGRDALEKVLGGKDSFFLPGAETFSALQDYTIRRGSEDVSIEAEYNRYISDIMQSVSSLEAAGEDDKKIGAAIKGFESSRNLLAGTTSMTLRNALSGRVLGSGTYRGRGISLGKGGLDNLGGKANLNTMQREVFEKVFDKTGGYALGADAQAFMDGMSTFKEAARRELMASTGKADVSKEVKEVMDNNLRNFFLGIYSDKPQGVMVDAQRNPLIGLSNIFGNIELFRSDIGGKDDKFFKLFQEADYESASAKVEDDVFRAAKESVRLESKKEGARIGNLAFGETLEKIDLESALYKKHQSLIDDLTGASITRSESIGSIFAERYENVKDTYKMRKEEFDKNLVNFMSKKGETLEVDAARSRYKALKKKDRSGIDRRLLDMEQKLYQEKAERDRMLNLSSEVRSSNEYRAARDRLKAESTFDFNERLKSKLAPERVSAKIQNQKLRELEALSGVKIGGFEDIVKARESVAATSLEDFDKGVNQLLSGMLRRHLSTGTQGGGSISFFDVEIESAKIMSGSGVDTGSVFSGRADVNKAAIGDYDGDIYQVFFRTNQEKFYGSGGPKKFMAAGLEMNMMMDQLSQGMNKLGQRMNVSDMALSAFRISEKEKERILKGVGGVDVQIKAGLFGLAQANLEAGAGADTTRRMKAGMTLLSAAQEILVIKSKKLKMASDIPEEFVSSMKEAFRTGKATRLKDFFRENVFRDTDLLKHGELRLDDIKFANLPSTGAGADALRSSYGSARININEIFDALDEMAASVKKHGFHLTASNSRLQRSIQTSRVADMNMLMQLLSAQGGMEGGVIGGTERSMDEVDRIMGGVKEIQSSMRASFMRKAGAIGIASALVGSYAVGSMMSPTTLDVQDKFSDMRARESMSMRGFENNMNRQHMDPGAGHIAPMDNFYERPIFSGETTVTSNVSSRFYGEAGSMPEMVQVGRRFIDAGGSANMLIKDNRMPISNPYVTRSLKD